MKYFTEMTAIITLTSNLIIGGGNGVDFTKLSSKGIIESINDIQTQENNVFNENNELEQEVADAHYRNLEKQKAIEKQQQQQAAFNDFVNIIKYSDVTRIDLRKPSGLTPELANKALSGTGLDGLGEAFVNSEEKYGVNAYYLMAHAAWESQWGKSNLSQTKNNLFGFQAYDADPYNKARTFSSKEESIDVVAKYVSKHYLEEDGDHYNGPTLAGMNVKYATDTYWAEGIGSIMNKFVYVLAESKGV